MRVQILSHYYDYWLDFYHLVNPLHVSTARAPIREWTYQSNEGTKLLEQALPLLYLGFKDREGSSTGKSMAVVRHRTNQPTTWKLVRGKVVEFGRVEVPCRYYCNHQRSVHNDNFKVTLSWWMEAQWSFGLWTITWADATIPGSKMPAGQPKNWIKTFYGFVRTWPKDWLESSPKIEYSWESVT